MKREPELSRTLESGGREGQPVSSVEKNEKNATELDEVAWKW